MLLVGKLYKITSLFILEDGDRLQWSLETHTSRLVGHFVINKMLINLWYYVL